MEEREGKDEINLMIEGGMIMESNQQEILEKVASCINILGDFCGARDLPLLTREALFTNYGMEQVDVMVLFGGTILCGGDVLADAIHNKIAKTYIIVGGEGHTTAALREKISEQFSELSVEHMSEASLFSAYLTRKYAFEPDYVECTSTNCGNNITFLLDLLKEEEISCNSILLSQDATMQLRMDAGLRKYAPTLKIINYATYKTAIKVVNGKLEYENIPLGMWSMERYITLLMGEISRLSDDEMGYGPNGKGYISHVDIKASVREAFCYLKEIYKDSVRSADIRYKSFSKENS
ncbi:MAG: hypothetical protein PWP24_628 [Clostridiales bacterium]|nr:hypothetical protein [Clostridiales bacterium]